MRRAVSLACRLGGLSRIGEAGLPFVQDEDVVAIFGEEHVIGFPVAGLGSIDGFGGPLRDRHAVFYQLHRTAALASVVPAP